jgi:hypothetical protein
VDALPGAIGCGGSTGRGCTPRLFLSRSLANVLPPQTLMRRAFWLLAPRKLLSRPLAHVLLVCGEIDHVAGLSRRSIGGRPEGPPAQRFRAVHRYALHLLGCEHFLLRYFLREHSVKRSKTRLDYAPYTESQR